MEISLINISIHYNGQEVLKNFNLELKTGDKLLITGKSGSGKSTLLKILAGLIHFDKGNFIVNGSELSKSNIWTFRNKLAYVSQDLNIGKGKVLLLLESIFSFKRNRHLRLDNHRLDELINLFRLNRDILQKDIDELSGGEKQRMIIIFSLMLDRDVYLLDEITSSLDVKMKQDVAEYFDSLQNKILLVVSHDPIWQKFSFQHLNFDLL